MLVRFKKMSYILAVLAAVSVLALVAGCTDEQKRASSPAAQTEQIQDKEKSAAAEPKELMVNVYYPRSDGTGLVAVRRTVSTEKDDKYTAAMKSLLTGTKEKGQTNVFPKKAKLRSVVVKDGIATVDFSKELQTNFSGGSTGEEMLIGSIVNTLTDFPEVQKVSILIDGSAVETLSGHMDLSEPLTRMTELLK